MTTYKDDPDMQERIISLGNICRTELASYKLANTIMLVEIEKQIDEARKQRRKCTREQTEYWDNQIMELKDAYKAAEYQRIQLYYS